jgi:hypothetical protein
MCRMYLLEYSKDRFEHKKVLGGFLYECPEVLDYLRFGHEAASEQSES